MIKAIANKWLKHKTKNFTHIPLFTMIFDYRKYKSVGKKGSCDFCCHPEIAGDIFVKAKLQEVVDYIRDNYDLDNFTRI